MNEQPHILVTGATGFIGSHLVTRLAGHGHRVRCLVRESSPRVATEYLAGLGADLVVGDLTERGSLDAPADGIATVFPPGRRRDRPDDVGGGVSPDQRGRDS